MAGFFVFHGYTKGKEEHEDEKAGRKTTDPLGSGRPETTGDPLRTHGKPPGKLEVM